MQGYPSFKFRGGGWGKTWGAADLGESVLNQPRVRWPTISGANSWAICFTSSTVRMANGLGITTIRAPGMPKAVARAWAALVKALVITLTDGIPWDSVTTVSWRPHAVQDPQSAIP